MPADINTTEYTDEGKIIATRLSDEWLLFVSDYDGRMYYVDPSIVDYI